MQSLGTELAGREFGEDLSFFAAAALALPLAREYLVYSRVGKSTNDATSAHVGIACACAMAIEHGLSIIGLVSLLRRDLTVQHSMVTWYYVLVLFPFAMVAFSILLATGMY